MRAIHLSRFGPPEELVPVEVPDPVPGPGRVLIDVAYANVTFVETQIRAGRPPHPSMAPGLPVVPGNGVGGTVAAVGEGVDGSLAGRRVIASTGGSGAYAERVAVDAEAVIPIPDGLGMEQAVALLADGRTALGLIRSADLGGGQTVLVEAAAGGVGSLLVQLAARAGARVVAAAGNADKVEVASGLGAHWGVDYGGDGWVESVRREIGEVDVVFDGVGGAVGGGAFELIRRGGRLISFGMASGAFAVIVPEDAEQHGVTVIRGVSLSPDELRRTTTDALDLAIRGELRAIVGQTWPLGEAAAAHAAIESRRTVGKTLLVVTGEPD